MTLSYDISDVPSLPRLLSALRQCHVGLHQQSRANESVGGTAGGGWVGPGPGEGERDK
jgi:hypothetical protein